MVSRVKGIIPYSPILGEQCSYSLLFSVGMISQGKIKLFSFPSAGSQMSPIKLQELIN